ncbi:MAG: tetratricopeptide repeat protein [Bacteroidetes bacterium]|nr:tetratricopeptide repeat protein [Bacteroidota bacterium]
MALEHLKINQHHTAIQLLKKVITLNPDYVAAYYQLGQALEKTNTAEAAAAYKSSIETATRIKNNHAKAELMSAYNMLTNDY